MTIRMVEHDLVLAPHTSGAQRIATLVAVLFPFVGLVAAICYAWGWGFSWVELTSLLFMYLATGIGITVGYHRLFAHRSFETVRPVRFVLAVLGSMSVQGPLLKWVAIHRRHHQHSDQAEDPHSPNGFGGGVRGMLAGLWHAHIGWMFTADYPNLSRYVHDLQRDKLLRIASQLFGTWVVLGLLIPTALGGLLTGTWVGALLGFLWGGLARIFLVHHVTWSINSICHLWGRRRFKSRDHSRNNLVCGFLALGEGWHNNHHAFPASAKHGLMWWELDLSFVVVRVLKLLGLAWRVQLPGPEAIAAKHIEADVDDERRNRVRCGSESCIAQKSRLASDAMV